MTPLRVLHVTPYAGEAWAYGGIPRIADRLARGLAARGHAVTVCATDACSGDRRLQAPDARGRFRAWRIRHGNDALDIRVFPNLSNRLAYRHQCFLPVGLSRYLRRHAPAFDIAHLHACRNLPGAIAARHLRAAGVPYVLAPNGTAPNIERYRTAKRAFDILLGRTVLHGAARVLAVTCVEREQLVRLGVPAERVALVPNPLAIDEFVPAVDAAAFRRRFGLDGPIVAYLGKLTPRKRVELLVEAFAALDAPGAVLVVAGNDMGAGRSIRAAVQRFGVGARTNLTGLLEGRARLELLAAADVVVYPSEHEIFGLVPLEAILAGTPVVVTDDSGCGEVIASTGGGLVVGGRAGALRAAMQHILDARAEWKQAASAAAARVRETFGTAVVCARLERLYHDVVSAA